MQIYLQDPVRNLTALRVEDPAAHALYHLIVCLKQYYTPVLILTGLLGNTMCGLSLRHTTFRRLSATPYLSVLAVVDSILLFSLLAVWLSHFGVDLYNSSCWCELLTYSTYMCGFLSVWLTLCLLVDRVATVYSEPSKVHKVCTPLKAKMTAIAFVIVAITVFLNVSLLYGLIHTRVGVFCIALPQFASALHVLSKLDMAFNFLLPYSAMLVLVILMTIRLRKLSLWRRNIIQTRDGRAVLDGCIRLPKRQKEMCLPSCVLCVVLLLLNSPSHVLRMNATLSDSLTEKTFLWQQLCMFLMFTRSALTFPILCVTNGSFRTAVGDTLLGAPTAACNKHRPGATIAASNVHRALVEYSLTALVGQHNLTDKV